MAFSFLVRSSLARARALMDSPKRSFRLNSPSLLPSSGSLHHITNHHRSSSTLFRFFSAQTTPMERGPLTQNPGYAPGYIAGSELLRNKETKFGDGEGEKSGQSNECFHNLFIERLILFLPPPTIFVLLHVYKWLANPAIEQGVEEKNKGRFEEFMLKLLLPGFVSKIIVVDHSLAVVCLKNNTKAVTVSEPEQPIDQGVYLLGIKSPESFKEELEHIQKLLRLDPLDCVPVIDLTKDSMNRKWQSATTRAAMK